MAEIWLVGYHKRERRKRLLMGVDGMSVVGQERERMYVKSVRWF